VEIDFDDEIHALIVLASLPNSWEAIRMAVSNYAGKSKLSYEDVRIWFLVRRSAGRMLVKPPVLVQP
jgi:hypothetical protein